MTQTYANITTAYFDALIAAAQAGGAAVNLVGGTVVVGDGNGAVPAISDLVAANGVTYEVWRGAVIQSVSIDPAAANQIDVGVDIPAASGGAEIGPFTVREFAILDALGHCCIVGTTNLEKTISSQGQTSDLAWTVAVVVASTSAVVVTPPTAGYATMAQVIAGVNANLPDCTAPLIKTDTAQSSGWLKRVFGIAPATQAAVGSGRAASDAEFAAGHAADGGFAWPWPTLQQIAAALAAIWTALANMLTFPPQTTYYVNFAAGNDATGDGTTTGTAWATLQKAINTISAKYIWPGTITIQCANGTLNVAAGGIAAYIPPSNIAAWNFVGNVGSPASCAINALATGARGFEAAGGGVTVFINGFQIAAYYEAVVATQQARVFVTGANKIVGVGGTPAIAFGAYGAYVDLAGAVEFFGAFDSAFCAQESGLLQIGYHDVNVTTTFAGQFDASSAVAVTAATSSGGTIYFVPSAITWTGSPAGARYSASSNGQIVTNGAGVNYLPGSTAGATASGGQYV